MRADHEATYRESYLSQDLSRGVIESDLHFKKRLHNAHSQDETKEQPRGQDEGKDQDKMCHVFPW